jgi:serine/threonine protein kinase
MGQGYRATDTKLKRQVGIKILPPSVAADHDRLARFQREAEVLASLNHPNIAGVHGLEESGGITALVMELVEGEDLSQRMTRGAIPLDEALPIAKQITDALEAAHAQGIMGKLCANLCRIESSLACAAAHSCVPTVRRMRVSPLPRSAPAFAGLPE